MQSKAYTTSVSEDFKYLVCSSCFEVVYCFTSFLLTDHQFRENSETNLPYICEICSQVAFCSEACKKKGHITSECQALSHISQNDEKNFSIDELSEIRIIVQALAKRTQEIEDESSRDLIEPRFNDYEMLVSNFTSYGENEKADIYRMTDLILKIFPQGTAQKLSRNEVAELFSKERCNVFGLWGPLDCYASCIYPSGSLFNHNCLPNISPFKVNPRIMDYIAIDKIPSQTELCISYINPRLPRQERIEALKEEYLFECICERCQNDIPSSDNRINHLLCSNNGCTGIVIPFPAIQKRICRDCRKEYP